MPPPPLPAQQQPAQTHQPQPSISNTNKPNGITTPLKIGIAVASGAGLIILITLTTIYIRWFKRKLLTNYGPTKISGPYVHDLQTGASKDYHGYREEELVDSGTSRDVNVGVEDKRVEFEVFAAELDGGERSRSRSRSDSRGRGKIERVPKQFF